MERKEAQILEQFKSRLDEWLNVEGLKQALEPAEHFDQYQPDFIFSIRFDNLQAQFAGEILAQQSLSNFEHKLYILKSFVAQHSDYLPFFLANYLSEERRKKCKEAEVNFLDLSGNAYLKHKSLFIEREGFPNLFPEKRAGRNPFSDKASLILREALKQKDKLWGVREIAQAGKLDPGFISRMLREMEKKRYVSRSDSKFKLENPVHILADWVGSYNYKKNEEFKYFCLAKSPGEILSKLRNLKIPDDMHYALGLQAGAALISPHALYNQVHVYVRNKSDIEFLKKSLSLKDVEEGANIVFLLPFYKHSVFRDKQKVKDLWVTSDIQLYLDLFNYPLRGREQAEHLYEKRLKQLIEDGRS